MTQDESRMLQQLMRLHDKVLNDPSYPITDELSSLAREAEGNGVTLFRLITDHYPAFLPYYYFFDEAQ
ncbi:MAG TPA: hypothetical protein VNT60_00890 [Deinococcales bacterium]|nr:hypothetical protein [Deinococcales bacterium]